MFLILLPFVSPLLGEMAMYIIFIITLSAATKLLSKQVDIFTARRECDNEYYAKACRAIDCGISRNNTDHIGKLPEIHKAWFYQALADLIAARMMPESEKSNEQSYRIFECLLI